jgi:hypothetical protein
MDVCVVRKDQKGKMQNIQDKDKVRLKYRVGENIQRKGIPVWARFSAPVQIGPGAHTVFYTLSTGFVFQG